MHGLQRKWKWRLLKFEAGKKRLKKILKILLAKYEVLCYYN